MLIVDQHAAIRHAYYNQDKSIREIARELHLSRQSGLTVLAIKPKGGPGTIPSGDTVFREGDVLVVGGTKENLDRSKLLHPRAR